MPAHATAGEDGVLDVDRPVFQLNHHIQKFYKLKEPKTKIPRKKNFALLCTASAFCCAEIPVTTWQEQSLLQPGECRRRVHTESPSTLPLPRASA